MELHARVSEGLQSPKVSPWDEPDSEEIPVLVVVVNDPSDLARARDQGWYRIPLARAPQRVAADYLAFYQTGAFPPDLRWTIRWLAPVQGYRIAARRDLIPDEPDHARADERYYRIQLGALAPLPHPIPSRRLRRITFIPTTLARLRRRRRSTICGSRAAPRSGCGQRSSRPASRRSANTRCGRTCRSTSPISH